MMRIAYLNEMTMISDQKISDTMPSTASGATCPGGTGGLCGDVERIERTRADIAENDAHAGKRRRRPGARCRSRMCSVDFRRRTHASRRESELEC